MKALLAPRPRRLGRGGVPEPAHGPGQVLVRTRVTAVSAGTELRMLYGDPEASTGGVWGGRPPEASTSPDWPAVGAFGYLACGDEGPTGLGETGLAGGERVTSGPGR